MLWDVSTILANIIITLLTSGELVISTETSGSTKQSESLHERALQVLPAGISYKIRYMEPYPFYVDSALGSKVFDVEGRKYSDYWCTHFSMILGHAHPKVKTAMVEQIDKGWNYGLSHELEVRHAELVNRCMPSVEMIRYTNSGTEGNMYAVRLARTCTKRTLIAKFEGGWHGGYDALHCAVKPPFNAPSSGGLDKHAMKDTLTLPYNDLEETRRTIRRRRLACIIVEPVLGGGGMIPAERDFLAGLRELCDENGALLIFDEVITGFRLGMGGGQEYFGVKPDLTVLGKIIGGGLPIGAVGGRRDLMEHMDHTKYSSNEYCFQGGTGAANILTLIAGEATIQTLMHEPVHERVNKLGSRLFSQLNSSIDRSRSHARITGVGSLFGIHLTKQKSVHNIAGWSSEQQERSKRLFRFLLKNEILLLAIDLPHGAVSYAHSEDEVDTFASRVEEYLKSET